MSVPVRLDNMLRGMLHVTEVHVENKARVTKHYKMGVRVRLDNLLRVMLYVTKSTLSREESLGYLEPDGCPGQT